MDKGLIPRRYAKALFETGQDKGANDALYALMQQLAASFAAEPEMSKTLANPFVPAGDKISLLTIAAGKGAAENGVYSDFLKLLAKNGRLDVARDIANAFIAIYRRANSIYRVAVVSAAPMGADEKKRLEAIIAKHIGEGSMEYDYSVDPALVGGFTVTVNSERLDASVASRLKQLRLVLVG